MVIKNGVLFTCIRTSISYGEWILSSVTLTENTLNIQNYIADKEQPKIFHLSTDWFIITSRPSSTLNCPPIPQNRKQDSLFALTQPSEVTIWFSASSKYERNQWIEKILPIITLKPPTPPEPPPPYSEYDNLSYYSWDNSSSAAQQTKEHSPFRFPKPVHKYGFYSLEKPIKDQPKPVELLPREPSPPCETGTNTRPAADSLQCVNCFTLGCAFICNTLSVCLQMCCNNLSTAF